MKRITLLLINVFFVNLLAFSQDSLSVSKDSFTFSKEDFIGTWRACGDVNWDEKADTLRFEHKSPGCKSYDCGEHNWSFRETGSIDFVFTDGCNSGFHSVSKSPKKWILIKKEKRLKFVTNDGYIEYFDIIKLDNELVLIHRKDLEEG
ncbi:MAG: hypothetical protein WED10_12985 [Brumimicrobium sp.]